MQIKDLSVKVERLDEVRGGIGNIDVSQSGAYVYADQSARIGGRHGQTSLSGSAVDTYQGIEANTKNKLVMPVLQKDVNVRSFSADNSNFSFKFGGWSRLA